MPAFGRIGLAQARYFDAYACAEELALGGRYVATSIVPEDMDEISYQMRESMGDTMTMIMPTAAPFILSCFTCSPVGTTLLCSLEIVECRLVRPAANSCAGGRNGWPGPNVGVNNL